ncbi:MAG: MBL fold metallo-hydrolase [Anaerolinea sp.]|nr:MBL fold metallo-hydrolase [Anaerolinea sp.]
MSGDGLIHWAIIDPSSRDRAGLRINGNHERCDLDPRSYSGRRIVSLRSLFHVSCWINLVGSSFGDQCDHFLSNQQTKDQDSMTINVKVFSTGQLSNNVVFLIDDASKEAIVVDPSYEPEILLDFINNEQLKVKMILLTHGHFDQFAGVNYLTAKLTEKPKLAIHRDDLELLKDGGGSKEFHMPVLPPDDPDLFLEDLMELKLGKTIIQVRLAPGHSSGSVIFYIPEVKTAICGDVIFHLSVGRTDLAGGSHETLIESIRKQVFSLPPDTRLIPGHGEETTVREEILHNPFLAGLAQYN